MNSDRKKIIAAAIAVVVLCLAAAIVARRSRHDTRNVVAVEPKAGETAAKVPGDGVGDGAGGESVTGARVETKAGDAIDRARAKYADRAGEFHRQALDLLEANRITPADDLREAEIMLIEGAYDGARSRYLAVIDSGRASVDEKAAAREGLGRIYFSSKNYFPAIEEFYQTLAGYPAADPAILADTHLLLARSFYESKNYARAADECRKIIAYYPESGLDFQAECRIQLGHSLRDDYKVSEAEKILAGVITDYAVDESVKGSARMGLLRIYRKETDLRRSFTFLAANYARLLEDFPAADLNTLSAAQFEKCYKLAGKEEEREAFLREWILCTPDYNRNKRTIGSLALSLRNADGGYQRAAQFLDYLAYGGAGKDEIPGTADDLTNPLPGFEKLTLESYRAGQWPGNLRNCPVPVPPIRTWDDLLAFFQEAYRRTGEDDRINTEKTANFIIACFKALDGHALRARSFLENEAASTRGIKRAMTRRVLLDLYRQDRCVKIRALFLKDSFDNEYRPLLRKYAQDAYTAAEENRKLFELAKACREKKNPEKAAELYRLLIATPLDGEADTVAAAAGELAVIYGQPEKAAELKKTWKELILQAARPSNDGACAPPDLVLGGITRALRAQGREDDAVELCRFAADALPDSAAASVVLAGMNPTTAEEYEAVRQRHPGTQLARAAVTKLIELSVSSGDYRQAARLAGEYLREFPGAEDKTRTKESLAGFYFQSGDYRNALKTYRELAQDFLPISPADDVSTCPEAELRPRAEFWQSLAATRGQAKRPEAAAFDDFLSRYPGGYESAAARYFSVVAFLEKKQFALARDGIEALKKEFPQSAPITGSAAVIEAALAEEKKNDAELTRVRAERERAQGEQAAESVYREGELLEAKADWESAIATFSGLAKEYPESELAPQALERMIAVYGRQLNDPRKTRETCERLVALYPERESAFGVLLTLLRLETRDGETASATVAVAAGGEAPETTSPDFSGFESLYQRGEYEAALTAGMPVYRNLAASRPEFGETGRRMAVINRAARDVSRELEHAASGGEKDQELAYPSIETYYESMRLARGDAFSPDPLAGGPENRFLGELEDSLRRTVDRALAEKWNRFRAAVPEAKSRQRNCCLLTAYWLLSREEDPSPDSLTGILSAQTEQDLLLDSADFCAETKHYQPALILYQKALDLKPGKETEISVIGRQAACHQQLQQVAEVLDLYQAITEKYPGDKDVLACHQKIIEVYFTQWKTYENAIRECRRLIERYPGTPEARDARLRIGKCFYMLNDFEKGISELENFIKTYGEGADVTVADFMTGLCLMGANRNDEALVRFQRFVANNPGHEYAVRAQYLVASLYVAKKDYANALTEYEQLTKKYTGSYFQDKAEKAIADIKQLNN